ncbi:MAG: autotransporter outer membrane beta-barrel domain-containing protein [Nitrospiraceae bacterium]|nr:MAG: autotransporter outer membrane beta-barrel domain-containing protein [Nitrospiraceae bacterium]
MRRKNTEYTLKDVFGMVNRQKFIAIVMTCFIFAGVESSFAGQLQKNTWELGPELSYIEYNEPDVMKEKGWMYGIAGSYIYHQKLMLMAEGRFSYGKLDYSSPISSTVDDIDNYIVEFRGLGGYDFTVSESSVLTPYIGVGYRYLNDDSSMKVTSNGARGYERESNYLYSPVGVKFISDLKDGWSMGAMAEYDIFWWGEQESHLSDVSPGFNDLKNHQTSGYGLRGSVELQKKVKSVAFAVEPFIRYWNIKESDHDDLTWYGIKIGEAWEPKNHSTEYGINLVVRF